MWCGSGWGPSHKVICLNSSDLNANCNESHVHWWVQVNSWFHRLNESKKGNRGS
jgi:hypothetical protein